MARSDIDWIKIEQDYRTGIFSVREIAREHDLSEGAIRKRAKAFGWERDLTDEVRARTRKLLVRQLADAQKGTQEQRAQTAEETTERAALTQVAVVREHQVSVHDGYSITKRLLDELNTTTSHAGELAELIKEKADNAKQAQAMQRAVSLPGRAAIMRDLAQAAKTWVGLERQAFSIVEDSKSSAPQVDARSIEEIKAEIRADAALLGIIPSSEPVGIAPGRKVNGGGNGTAH